MKKNILFTILLLLISIILLGCEQQETSNLPKVKVKLTHKIEENVHYFNWNIENVSKTKEQILTFNNGNIINYEIRNDHSNKIYKKNITEKNNSIIILKKGEQYEEVLTIKDLDEGHYSVKFWAISEEGINPTTSISFDVQ